MDDDFNPITVHNYFLICEVNTEVRIALNWLYFFEFLHAGLIILIKIHYVPFIK